MLSGVGFYYLLKYNKKFGMIVLILLISSSFWSVYERSINAKLLVDEEELKIISELQHVEDDAYVMSVSSYYSPWLLGYSGKKVIAPGLFDYDKWNYSQWKIFWRLGDGERAVKMLSIYEKSIYIYIGRKDHINEAKFENEHFEKVLDRKGIKIYRFNP